MEKYLVLEIFREGMIEVKYCSTFEKAERFMNTYKSITKNNHILKIVTPSEYVELFKESYKKWLTN